ncbi:MAG: 6-phosphogluconolactonase [Algoriphagus sp.]|nr:6-phosphogluconolactonase [Algoriphagus sp.]
MSLKTEIFTSADQVAEKAAAYLEQLIRETLTQKKTFSMAISGGRTPWEMLKILSKASLPWQRINLFQVDERVAPDGHEDRNLTQLFRVIEGSPLVTRLHIFPMPVTAEILDVASQDYSQLIHEITEDEGLDLIHLGMGSDGHTASLVPGDRVLEINDRDVACTEQLYQGRIRMTLTYPLLNSAKRILWIVTGAEKQEMVQRLLKQDASIPAGAVNQANALLMVDQAAFGY